MAFRLIRQRREQRRTAKLEEIFQVNISDLRCSPFIFTLLLFKDRDKSLTGKISLDQLMDIFRIYQVNR